MDDRTIRRFSILGALAVGVAFTLLSAVRERRFSPAGLIAAAAWFAATTLVRTLALPRRDGAAATGKETPS